MPLVDGRVVGEAFPGGSRSYAWTAGRLTGFEQIVDGQSRSTALEYDAAGRLKAETTAGVRTDYSYDAAGQLVGASPAGGSAVSFAYDVRGNRVSSTEAGAVTSYSWDAAGQLVGIDAPAGATALTYDAAGRRVGESGPDGTVSYSWDARGRLAAVGADDGQAATAVARGWDAADRLASLAASGPDGETQASLLWDANRAVPQVARVEVDGEASDLVYGRHRLLAVDGEGAAAFAYDAHGSALTTTATADLVADDGYGPWGEPLTGLASDGYGFGYRGELHVGDLVHLRARDYHPATAASTAVDPLDGVAGLPTIANPYHYAHNSPFVFADPLGLTPVRDGDLRGPWTDENGENIPVCTLRRFVQAADDAVTFGMWSRITPLEKCRSDIYIGSDISGEVTTAVAAGVAGAYGASAGPPSLGAGAGGAAATGTGRVASTIDDVLARLRPGKQANVRTVGSEAELRQVYNELAEGATPTRWSKLQGKGRASDRRCRSRIPGRHRAVAARRQTSGSPTGHQ